MSKDFQDLLDEAFPPKTDEQVIRGVTEGVLLADAILESEPMLQSPVGKDSRGHLRRAGIMFRMHDLCTIGDLPFSSRMTKMPRGGCHWLELESLRFTAHICRTDGPSAFPVDTPTHQDERLSNQLDLFRQNVVPFPTVGQEISSLSTWLTFGVLPSGKLGHACWAMPAANTEDWIAHTNILKRAASSEKKVLSPPEAKGLILRFRKEIEDEIDKNDAESEDQEN